MSWKCAQDGDEFVSESASAMEVNGCRQNESLIKTSQMPKQLYVVRDDSTLSLEDIIMDYGLIF